MTDKYDEGIGHFLTTLRNADWLVNKLKGKKKTNEEAPSITVASTSSEYDELIDFSKALDGLYDCNGDSYSIDQDVYKALDRFETAYYKGLFINEEKKPAADLVKKLLSGLESKLIAAGRGFEDGDFTKYLQDLKAGKVSVNKNKVKADIKEEEPPNIGEYIIDTSKFTEKEKILTVLDVMRSIQASDYDKWSTNTLKSFFDLGQNPKSKNGDTVEVKEEIEKICLANGFNPEYVYGLFSDFYVKNRLNTSAIYTSGYEPYVRSALQRNGYNNKQFLKATVEYSILECMRKMAKQSKDAEKLYATATEMSGIDDILPQIENLPDDTGHGLEIKILISKLKLATTKDGLPF